MKKLFQFSILFLIAIIASSQDYSEKDSLQNLISKEKKVNEIIGLYNEFAWAIIDNEPALAKEYLKKSITMAKSVRDFENLANAYNKMGIIEKLSGNYNKALEYYNLALESLDNTDDESERGMVYNNMGNVYKSKGDYAKALDYLLKALKVAEKINENESIADALLNIGLLYDDLGKDSLAMQNLQKSLDIAKNLNNKMQIARAMQNMANIYSDGDELSKKKALEYYFKALDINIEISVLSGQATCLNNIGAVYYDLGDWKKAEEYYLKSFKIKEQLGDRRGKAIISENLAFVEQQKKNYKKAGEFLNYSMIMADSISDAKFKIELMLSVAENYFYMGDYKSASKMQTVLFNYKDSIFNSEMTGQISEMQTKYETEKKEAQIQKKNLELEKKDVENRNQRIIIYSVIAGLALLVLLLLIVFKMFRDKKIANAILSQQKEEITAQRDEIEAQRNLAAEQRDLISEQKQEITDSIHYAFRIQSAIIPEISVLNNVVADSFIFHVPRDIVSGDFYWIGEQDHKIIILAADCTGHGVPGAFMSMLGIAFLNEIVSKENITSPAEILNELRNKIVKALKQQGKSGEQKDGMDISVITIDPTHNHLQFSGANNPLYLIRNNDLVEIKGDKMPVAIHDKMESFVNHEMAINKGDNIYIFTDGFADQFGGPQGKKFKYKPFKELLVKNTHLPLTGQQALLKETFVNWKGTLDQVDDVLVIGVRI